MTVNITTGTQVMLENFVLEGLRFSVSLRREVPIYKKYSTKLCERFRNNNKEG